MTSAKNILDPLAELVNINEGIKEYIEYWSGLNEPGISQERVKKEIKDFERLKKMYERSILRLDNENKKAVWKFDKVQLVNIRPYMDVDGKKVHNKCYVTIDFGFFMVHDIGINNDEKFGLTWSQDFGWSRFKLCDSYIDNPYGDEVRKLETMIRDEIRNKNDQIIEFLNDQRHCTKSFIMEDEIHG